MSFASTSLAPFPAPKGLPGTRGRGLTYQRRVGDLLRPLAVELGWEFYAEKWVYFERWLQPDFILIAPSGGVLILEAKLTYTEWAWPQLQSYARAMIQWGYRPLCVQVCRNLTPQCPRPVTDFEDLEDLSIWHLFL